jgi:glyoxylase I family protein
MGREATAMEIIGLHGLEAGHLHHTDGAEGVGPALSLEDPEGNNIERKGPPQG